MDTFLTKFKHPAGIRSRNSRAICSTAAMIVTLTLAACGGSGGTSAGTAPVTSNNDNNETRQVSTLQTTTSTSEAAPPTTNAVGEGCFMLSSLPNAGIMGLDSSNTPRANQTAELLSIEARATAVAESEHYERVVAELQGLRASFPRQTTFDAMPCNRPNAITLWLNEDNGNTNEFAQFNQQLEVSKMQEVPAAGSVIIEFDGVYNTNRLAAEYEALPNVAFAEPDYIRGDGNDICLEELPENEHLYIFDQADGDCPSTCLGHEYHGFKVDADGNITALGSYNRDSGAVEPKWFANAQQCRAFL